MNTTFTTHAEDSAILRTMTEALREMEEQRKANEMFGNWASAMNRNSNNEEG